jgi:xanthine/CO dehydrogenase XdhC/CoxF family maturation factor
VTHTELVALLQSARSAITTRPGVPLALATLVAVDGSSYRQPGARMLCDADGRVLAGAISGGCLEADVALRAADVCARGTASLIAYDLREDLETIWGFGSGCEGVAHIMLAPLPDLGELEAACSSAELRQSGVLLTTIEATDSACVGRTLFVRDAAPALALRSEMNARVQDTVRHTDQPFLGQQTTPSGTERTFGAPVRPPVHLIVVGASRGAESFARIGMATGWRVTVIDDRTALLDALELPSGVQRMQIAPANALDAMKAHVCPVDSRTMFALCTHRFDADLAWLQAALATESPYVGVLGSRQRAGRLVRSLVEAKPAMRARDRARLFAPIGLDIGGESPDEVALASLAEMQAVLHSRPGGSLRERQAPLHTRTPTPKLVSEPGAPSCVTPSVTSRERR